MEFSNFIIHAVEGRRAQRYSVNYMDHQKLFIQAEEVLLKVNKEWLHFTSPHRVIQANTLHAVIPALSEIEDLVQINGWHAAGFISYEAAPAFDPAHQTRPGTGFPYLWFGLYLAPRLVPIPQPDLLKPALSWLASVDRNTYNSAISQIKSYIADGRTYQVNYTMRLRTRFNATPWNFFLHLAQIQNNHAAYLDLGQYVICSASPELFFRLDGDILTCRPMKGTIRRGRTTQEDQEQAQSLKESEKNRAENVMIVDMIRNDLGRIAKIGSVQVPELITVERYPTLWQMTSTVRARTDTSFTQIFKALFPCASITGAPKVSTMRIISKLETSPRKMYTGSIGYIAPNRRASFNVAIRTVLVNRQEQTAEYGVGGGIVWDSNAQDEYEEALLKVRVLTDAVLPPGFSLFETILWTPEEGYFLREKHIARLLDSADYFDFPLNLWQATRLLLRDKSRSILSEEVLASYLDHISTEFNSPRLVRLFVDKNGELHSDIRVIQALEKKPLWKACLAGNPVNSEDIFLFHKTTKREVYEAARKDLPQYDDVLLYNERDELTEFTTGNLVVEMDNNLYTPPIRCGLLAGTFRERLLETGKVKERVIAVANLKKCKKIFLVNSVRQWIQIRLV